MKRLARLFSQREFAVLLFLVCLVLFNWHYVGLPDQAHGYAAYVYLFSAWAVVIALLFLMERTSKAAEDEEAEVDRSAAEERDV